MGKSPSLFLVSFASTALLLLCCGLALVAGYFVARPATVAASPAGISQATHPPSPKVPYPLSASCLSAMDAVLQGAQGKDHGPQTGDSKPDWTPLVTYEVSGDSMSAPSYERVIRTFQPLQHNTDAQQSAWTLFTSLVPADQRTDIEQLLFFTDGPGNILAAVQQSGHDSKLWVLEVDAADLGDRAALAFTLVHELGHLLTLDASQVPPDPDIFAHPDDHPLYEKKVEACTTYFPGEGCSLPDSYINAYYAAFWPALIQEWRAVDALSEAADRSKYYQALRDFYDAHRDQFVDHYAATDPAEDIAETFAYFVFSPRPEGDTGSEYKMLFFYEYPELVRLREQIRQNLCKVDQ